MPIKHEWNGTILTITSDSGTSSADLQGVKGATGARGARGLTGRTGGGALIEDGVIRDDTTWSSAGIMDRFAEAFSIEGNPVVCNNALANVPFNVITEFDVKQEGTGNPYPAGSKKNIFDYTKTPDNLAEVSVSAITNGIKVTARTANKWIYCRYKFNLTSDMVGKTYTLSADSKASSTNQPGVILNICDANYKSKFLQRDVGANKRLSVSFTITSEHIQDGYSFCATFYGNAEGTSVRDDYIEYTNIQLEEGSTATAYEPYSNIRPIVGYDNISITRSGKNLLNFPNREAVEIAGVIVSCSNGAVSFKGTSTGTVYTNGKGIIDTPTLPNGAYKVTGGTSNVDVFAKVIENGTAKYYYKGETFIISDTNILEMISCRMPNGKTADEIVYPMLVLADETDLTYEPYKGETFTLSLGNTYAQGVLDWNTGELIVDKYSVVLNGSEPWGKTGAGNAQANNAYRFYLSNNAYLPNLQPSKDDVYKNETLICSHYTVLPYADIPKGKTGIGVNKSTTAPVLGLYNPLFDNYTIDEFKAELAKEPITICYELAEPQNIKLEPQIIKALSGTNTLLTNADNLLLVGRIDTMKTIQELLARVSALEAKVGE